MRFEKLLVDAQLIDDVKVKEIYQEMGTLIEKAVTFAENSPEPEVKDVMEWVYA